ncbi:ATP-binding protein [Streptomyces sp. NPDC102274]|uniref:ATP-binding protein n=1 Tax=Streptomyces sp. NPDC102274 TaxID=3366151 RepID=UPI00381F8AFB
MSTPASLKARLVRTAVLPHAVVLGPAAVCPWLIPGPLGVAVPGTAAAAVVVSWLCARSTARTLIRQREMSDAAVRHAFAQLLQQTTKTSQGLYEVAKQMRQGGPVPAPRKLEQWEGGSPAGHVAHALADVYNAALAAVSATAGARRVEVLNNLARRLQNLVDRALQGLDAVEMEIEAPTLLGDVLSVDHMVTRIRRQADSIAVVGGAVPRRFTDPLALPAVLRQAMQEIEAYHRVQVIEDVDVLLHGHVAPDIIHLFAELMENATRFSPPETDVHITARMVRAGVAVEIQDRGLTMSAQVRDRLNDMFAAAEPDRVIDKQLKDGRIGTLVVALLARRQNKQIAVRLEPNIFGGTQTIVLLPHALLVTEEPGDPEHSRTSAPPLPAGPGGPSAPVAARVRPHVVAALPVPDGQPRPQPDHTATTAQTRAPEQGLPQLARRTKGYLAPELRRTARPSGTAAEGGPTAGLATQFFQGRAAARRDAIQSDTHPDQAHKEPS